MFANGDGNIFDGTYVFQFAADEAFTMYEGSGEIGFMCHIKFIAVYEKIFLFQFIHLIC